MRGCEGVGRWTVFAGRIAAATAYEDGGRRCEWLTIAVLVAGLVLRGDGRCLQMLQGVRQRVHLRVGRWVSIASDGLALRAVDWRWWVCDRGMRDVGVDAGGDSLATDGTAQWVAAAHGRGLLGRGCERIFSNGSHGTVELLTGTACDFRRLVHVAVIRDVRVEQRMATL